MTRWHFFYPFCQFFHNGSVFAKCIADDLAQANRIFIK